MLSMEGKVSDDRVDRNYLENLIQEGEHCSQIVAAKAWKSKVEIAIRRAILRGPSPLAQKLNDILSDIQRLNFEMGVQRLSGPDTILDVAHKDQVIGLTKLACEIIAAELPDMATGSAEYQRQTIKQKQRHGPLPAMENHRKISEVVKQQDGDWREEAVLEKIAEELDQKIIPLPKGWKKWDRKPRNWKRAAEYHLDRVRKRISYSLKMAARKSPSTLGNSD